MNWQTELNSSLSWILTALFWVVLCFSVVMIALKQTSFGQKFWHIASPSINRRNSIKIILMLLVLFTMILLEVRFSVLNSFFYNGLYSSMQELDADKFWFFAKLNALLVLVQVIHSIADYFLQQVFEIRWLESLTIASNTKKICPIILINVLNKMHVNLSVAPSKLCAV